MEVRVLCLEAKFSSGRTSASVSERAQEWTCTSVSLSRRDWIGGEVGPRGTHQRAFGADSRCSCAADARAVGECASFSSVSQEVIQDKVQQRVVEQNIGQSTRDQILDVPMPLLEEQLVELPKIVFQDRIGQRTFEQFSDILKVVEELVFKDFFPRTGFNSVLFNSTSFFVCFETVFVSSCGAVFRVVKGGAVC